MSNRQTLDHILHLEHDVKSALSQKQYTMAIFINFSKALDMVWHNGLKQKLKEKAIDGRILNVIHSVLTDRNIIVKSNQTHTN